MRTLCAFSIIVVLGCVENCLADKPAPPYSYRTLSPNEKFVFVMISPLPLKEELASWNEKKQAELKGIRAKYKTSGLYKNDGSIEPLWTVDWYRHQVAVASDGVHLVRSGPWPIREGGFEKLEVTKDELKQEAITFFAKGKLLRQYAIAELVDDPKKLELSVSHFMWRKEARIIDKKSQLEIVTHDGNRLLYDLATAKLVEKNKVN